MAKPDYRPASQRTASGRFEEPSLFNILRDDWASVVGPRGRHARAVRTNPLAHLSLIIAHLSLSFTNRAVFFP